MFPENSECLARFCNEVRKPTALINACQLLRLVKLSDREMVKDIMVSGGHRIAFWNINPDIPLCSGSSSKTRISFNPAWLKILLYKDVSWFVGIPEQWHDMHPKALFFATRGLEPRENQRITIVSSSLLTCVERWHGSPSPNQAQNQSWVRTRVLSGYIL